MDKYGESLTKMAYNYVKDWKLAEDIVQDIFVTCYHNYDKIDQILSFKAWIFRLTINKSKDLLKSSVYRKTVVQSSILTLFKSNDPAPETVIIKQNEEELLALSVLDLPMKYREVIILHYYEDLPIEKICEILVMNPNTVKTRLSRGRARLKKLLERRGDHE
ncbi:sigma-70 family RNA polymerase sigma factor [Bacillus salacetis]|uniref:Sigma-70 family RNA polymerase sigma factor n=2 Tax=Bacillus salacetis TaxID=2315464 RepID=A0A3A1R370_9BACI|nr:sigma-70 family RNA polymerase sigma factor [Bacillus salacetis]